MRFDILTIFPEMLRPFLFGSILGKAANAGIIDIVLHDIRDYTADKHRRTDDYPFGGGWGMIMTPQPIVDCHRAIIGRETEHTRTIYLSPQGSLFNQDKAKQLLRYDRLILLCGHYEGVDQRVIDAVVDEEISVGDYVLTGGEIPAAVLVDAVARLVPGVLSDEQCHAQESIASGILEYPQYTRPRDFEGMRVPEILVNGHHANIDAWRRGAALEKTLRVRPDLFEKADLSESDRKFLAAIAEEFKLETTGHGE